MESRHRCLTGCTLYHVKRNMPAIVWYAHFCKTECSATCCKSVFHAACCRNRLLIWGVLRCGGVVRCSMGGHRDTSLTAQPLHRAGVACLTCLAKLFWCVHSTSMGFEHLCIVNNERSTRGPHSVASEMVDTLRCSRYNCSAHIYLICTCFSLRGHCLHRPTSKDALTFARTELCILCTYSHNDWMIIHVFDPAVDKKSQS